MTIIINEESSYMIKTKIYYIIIFLIASSIQVCSQKNMNMVEKLGIKADIKDLDCMIMRKVQKDSLLNKYNNDLVLVHVFKLTMSNPLKKLTKEDYMNYSFLDYLKPNYVGVRERKWGKKKKYLDACTYLVSPKGNRLDMYETGHKYFYSCASTIHQDLLPKDKDVFIFMNSFDSQFQIFRRNSYIVIKDNNLYVYEDFSESPKLIQWENYINNLKWD